MAERTLLVLCRVPGEGIAPHAVHSGCCGCGPVTTSECGKLVRPAQVVRIKAFAIPRACAHVCLQPQGRGLSLTGVHVCHIGGHAVLSAS
jgi:hypothetical protein